MIKLNILTKLVGNQDNFWNQAVIELNGGTVSENTEKFLLNNKVKFRNDKVKMINKCCGVEKLYRVLMYVRDHLMVIDGEKSIWEKIKNSFSRQSTTTELLKILDNLFFRFRNEKIDDDVKLFLAWVRPINELPKRNGSRVPYEFIEAVGKAHDYIEGKFDEQQKMNIQLDKLMGNKGVEINELIEERRERIKDIKQVKDKKEAPVGGSVDDSLSQWAEIGFAKDDKGNEYSLKTIDVSKSKPGTHNLVRSEILACETLASLNCDYISKPIEYDLDENDFRKAKVAYKISKGLLGTKFINSIESGTEDFKKFKSTSLGAKCFKLIMEHLIDAVEKLHDKGLHHGNLSYESFKIDVSGESVDKLKVSLKVINFGYCYKIKGKYRYNEDDFLEHCHPVVSIIMFYYGVRSLAHALLGEEYANELRDKVYEAAGESLRSLIESAKKQYNCPYNWREAHLKEAMNVYVPICDKVFGAIKEWSTSKSLNKLIFEQKNNS